MTLAVPCTYEDLLRSNANVLRMGQEHMLQSYARSIVRGGSIDYLLSQKTVSTTHGVFDSKKLHADAVALAKTIKLSDLIREDMDRIEQRIKQLCSDRDDADFNIDAAQKQHTETAELWQKAMRSELGEEA